MLYEDERDASDAIYYLDGYELDGKRLRVELKRGAGGMCYFIPGCSQFVLPAA